MGSNLRWCQEKRTVGVRLVRELKTIRLLFDERQRLRRIPLVFEETATPRHG